MPEHQPLEGRVALVTGVSRSIGIGASVATRLHQMGATVFATGWPEHDEEMQRDISPLTVPFPVAEHDLEDPEAPSALVDEVIDLHGRLDILVAVHARSSSQSLDSLTAEELHRSWMINVQSILLLAQRFAIRHDPAPDHQPPTGRMLWFTSGQHLEPMESELAYAVTKGALHQMTGSLNKALSKQRITANCINPGPVDTGYAGPDRHQRITAMFPDQRWGAATDVANLVAFLTSEEGSWIRGQVLNSEGGFER